MLQLRPATVVQCGPPHGEQQLVVGLDGEGEHPAVADVALVGAAEVGDRVVVNVQARELGLGSGGFDIVHVNLTRGLHGAAPPAGAVMKLNYTSLQHGVEVVEDVETVVPLDRPAAVLALHGQLAPLAHAFAAATGGSPLGYVQTSGGALPGSHSRVTAELRRRGLLAGHITAGPAYGGELEAVSTAGAIHHGLRTLGWEAVVCGPGPGIVGSGTPLGHGGLAALDSAHAALALGCPTLLVARMSGAEARARHRAISHHTLTVLDLLLAAVTVAVPAGAGGVAAGARSAGGGDQPRNGRRARLARHDWRPATADLEGFAASGLPAVTMGRPLAEDPLFFASALAAGAVLAELAA